jgi:hypothetical protein
MAGRNKHQSAGFSKSVSSNMQAHTVEAIGKWGADLLPAIEKRKRLTALLMNFYGLQHGRLAYWSEDEINRSELLGKYQKLIEQLMTTALLEGDQGFFEDLSKLIPLSQPGHGASPVEYALLILWSLRDPDRQEAAFEEQGTLLSAGKLRDEMDLLLLGLHRMAEHDFPQWPASITELHDHFKKLGYTWDKKTIRDAIKKMHANAGISISTRKIRGKNQSQNPVM